MGELGPALGYGRVDCDARGEDGRYGGRGDGWWDELRRGFGRSASSNRFLNRVPLRATL